MNKNYWGLCQVPSSFLFKGNNSKMKISIDKNKKQCTIGSELPNKKGVFYEV
jgi:hypothetical protein